MWNTYIRSNAKELGKIFGLLYYSRNYIVCPVIRYLCKGLIRQAMESYGNILAGPTESSLSTIDSAQKRIIEPVGDELFTKRQPLFNRGNVASLNFRYSYFHGKCSKEIYCLIPPLQTFHSKNSHATCKKLNQVCLFPYFICKEKVPCGRLFFENRDLMELKMEKMNCQSLKS